ATVSDFTNGGLTLPASSLAWKRYGVSEAWSPFAAATQQVGSPATPGVGSRQLDLRVSIPASQGPATYSGSVVVSVVPQP
ncbi:MAG: hypothetical protein JWM86_1037, partial [Thermoleophilia bacterium]|nr:hypothetical protein [Thermoleophilia bacterium]